MFNDLFLKIPAELLWGFLIIFILVFLFFSFSIKHHWKYYGIRNNPKIAIKVIFWLVAILLILTMLVSIVYYEDNLRKNNYLESTEYLNL